MTGKWYVPESKFKVIWSDGISVVTVIVMEVDGRG